jgi:hypothetical protein
MNRIGARLLSDSGKRRLGRHGAEGAVVGEQAPDDARELVGHDDERVGLMVPRFAAALVEPLEIPVAAVQGARGKEEGVAQVWRAALADVSVGAFEASGVASGRVEARMRVQRPVMRRRCWCICWPTIWRIRSACS